jgi:acetate kinase
MPDLLDVTESVAVFNAGSTSLKFGLYGLDATGRLPLICRGSLDGLRASPVFSARDGEGKALASRQWEKGRAIDHSEAMAFIIDWLKPHLAATPLAAVGHRILLGGARYQRSAKIDRDVLDYLDSLAAIEPSHQAIDVKGARAMGEIFPSLPQVACFDNAFHATLADAATTYAVPQEVRDMGVRHWGFHGLSYDYVSRRIAELAPKARRVIAAHLGGGASMCAMLNGRSIDTTMGMGALSGLPMATRSGDVPPEVLLYLLRAKGFDGASLERMLYERSGLLGLSGLSGDMTDLESSGDPNAAAAIAHFVYAITKYAGAHVAVLEGLDAVVFTGGVGEHSARVRAAVCDKLGWLGVELDADANRSNSTRISTPRSKVSVWVVPTDEEVTIARQTAVLLASV